MGALPHRRIELGASGVFKVMGLPEPDLERLSALASDSAKWRQIFAVFAGHVDAHGPGQRLPMLGSYQVKAGVLQFTPLYPLIPGQSYSALFDPDGGLEEGTGCPGVVAHLDLPEVDKPATRALAIHPSADVLPENLLRFYVFFSAPMREGEALHHIRLLDEEGRALEGVFYDVREELWDPSRTRLTILLDPGRVKSGLAAHERLGRGLEAGRRYRLVIDPRWQDARGEPLSQVFEKRFTVRQPSTKGPDLRAWQMVLPAPKSQTPLSARFPEPLDSVLAGELIAVRRAGGEVVRGTIALQDRETLWQLVPEEPWNQGDYTLEVDSRLEDVAGNNLHGLFDRPHQSKEAQAFGRVVSVPFRV